MCNSSESFTCTFLCLDCTEQKVVTDYTWQRWHRWHARWRHGLDTIKGLSSYKMSSHINFKIIIIVNFYFEIREPGCRCASRGTWQERLRVHLQPWTLPAPPGPSDGFSWTFWSIRPLTTSWTTLETFAFILVFKEKQTNKKTIGCYKTVINKL